MIKQGEHLDDLICKAGAADQYYYINNLLNNELEDILKLLLINHIIDNNIDCNIDILDNINYYQIERFSDLMDLIDEYTMDNQE